MARRDPYIVGLDVGTTKVCAVIGEPTDDGALEIIGVGVAESHGQKKGSVVDVDSTVDSIKAKVFENPRVQKELPEGTAPDELRIVFLGKQLDDDRTLADYSADNLSTLHLLLRLKGGMGVKKSVVKLKSSKASKVKTVLQEEQN